MEAENSSETLVTSHHTTIFISDLLEISDNHILVISHTQNIGNPWGCDVNCYVSLTHRHVPSATSAHGSATGTLEVRAEWVVTVTKLTGPPTYQPVLRD
jgi:hypothetical protein